MVKVTSMSKAKKYFKEDPMIEKVAKSRAMVFNHISTIDNKTRMLEMHYGKLTKSMMTHILEDMETYGPIALAGGAPQATVDLLPELYEDTSLLREIQTAFDNHTGFFIAQVGSDYFVDDLAYNKAPCTMTHDEMPDAIRERVGMLKLMHNETFVRGIGLKFNETSFYVMPIVDKVN